MMNQKTISAGLLGIIFVLGAGVILYRGRPVMRITSTDTQATSTANQLVAVAGEPQATSSSEGTVSSTNPVAKPKVPSTSKANEYTLAQVQAHGSTGDCWATIGGSVYELTSWIARHPGGERPIERLCGTDASAQFESQHGGSRVAKAALALLKIGTLR